MFDAKMHKTLMPYALGTFLRTHGGLSTNQVQFENLAVNVFLYSKPWNMESAMGIASGSIYISIY